MKLKQLCIGIGFSLLAASVLGCGKAADSAEAAAPETAGPSAASAALEAPETSASPAAPETVEPLPIEKVMDRILLERGLSGAASYDTPITDIEADALVLLCQSESGKYTAYGIISPEYGQKGILINNRIDGEDNCNYFGEYTWVCGDTAPTLQEQGEYDVLFTFYPEAGRRLELSFQSYDTGTMSLRE